MSEDAAFAGLIVVYAAATAWSLSLFYLRRAAGGIAPMSNDKRPTPILAAVSTGFRRRPLIRSLALCTAFAALVGLPLFLMTPRSAAEPWAFGKPKLENRIERHG